MVGLADHQPGAHVEAEVDHRAVGLGDVLSVQRRVGAGVHDIGGAGVEEEGQVHASRDQHHEAVQGDFAEHERPVIGEDLVERLAGELRAADAVVDGAHQALGDHRAAPAAGGQPGADRSAARSQATPSRTPPTTAAAPP